MAKYFCTRTTRAHALVDITEEDEIEIPDELVAEHGLEGALEALEAQSKTSWHIVEVDLVDNIATHEIIYDEPQKLPETPEPQEEPSPRELELRAWYRGKCPEDEEWIVNFWARQELAKEQANA